MPQPGFDTPPEVPRRRSYTPEYKRAIVDEYYERCTERGAKSALLRREGLSGGLLVRWRYGKGNVHGSRAAAAQARRRPRTGLTPFGLFIVRQVDLLGISQAELARQVGVSPTTVARWINHGVTPTGPPYERLQAMFPGKVPGLETATEERQALFAQMLESHGDKGRTPEARRKAGQTMRGKRRGPSEAGKVAQTKRVAEGRHPINAVTAATVNAKRATPTGFANWYLRNGIGKLARTPDRMTIRGWAGVVAARYPADLTAEAVMELWRPELRRRGIRIDGRPPDEDRCAMVEALRREHGDGRGFWTWAAPRVWAAEGAKAPSVAERHQIEARTVDYLRLWHRRHLPHCSRIG